MRLGVVAALIFMVLGLGVLYGSVTNEPLIDSEVEESMETMMSASKVVEEGDWGNWLTLVAAPFTYFDSLVSMAWKAFDNPLFTTGGWAIVPYFTISPFVIVLFFGLIILLIGIMQKQV